MKKTILVVEDEEEIRRDILMTLNLSNYEVIGAENGKTGLDLAIKHKPDLIISDIMMPELDGYGFLAEAQKNPETSTIPFLFLSAKSDIREGMNFGADDFITKPYDIDELIEAIETRLKKKEASESKFLKKFEELSTRISQSLPHEIRTPLGIILGYSDFLIKKFDNTSKKDAIEMLQNIHESGRRMNRLFENHIFYAKLETIASSAHETENIKKGSSYLADSVIHDLALNNADNYNRSRDIDLNLSEGSPALSIDFLKKIVEELLDNAMKFSQPDTKVILTTHETKQDYFLTVKDHGRGMTKEHIKNVGAYIQFERQIYEQQGSGLGIAIVKKIISLIDGEFNIESVPNEFTEVTVKLPKK